MKILLVGRGKMGQAAAQIIRQMGGTVLAAVGRDNALLLNTLPPCDGVLDLSHPAMTRAVCDYVQRTKTPLCCGTTGQSDGQKAALARLGGSAPVLVCPNFSPGLQLLHRWLCCREGELSTWQKAVVESHHLQKADAPSGTARLLADAAGIPPERIFSLRGGTDPGTHRILLMGQGETLEVIHRAESRQVFARGAVQALQRLMLLPPGFYTPQSVFFPKEGAPHVG